MHILYPAGDPCHLKFGPNSTIQEELGNSVVANWNTASQSFARSLVFQFDLSWVDNVNVAIPFGVLLGGGLHMYFKLNDGHLFDRNSWKGVPTLLMATSSLLTIATACAGGKCRCACYLPFRGPNLTTPDTKQSSPHDDRVPRC